MLRRHANRATILTSWSCSASTAPTASNGAEAAERDLTKLKLLHYLSDRIGEEMDALVTGVENFGLFVQGIELAGRRTRPCRHAQRRLLSLRPRHAHPGRHRSGNSYRLGDLLRVVVARVDLERRELDFRLVERKRTSPAFGEAAPLLQESKSSRQEARRQAGRRAETEEDVDDANETRPTSVEAAGGRVAFRGKLASEGGQQTRSVQEDVGSGSGILSNSGKSG